MRFIGKVGAGLAVFVTTMLVAVILYSLFVWVPVSVWAKAKCLECGWKEAQVTLALRCYCIREENEYEIVRPLSEIIAESTGQ